MGIAQLFFQKGNFISTIELDIIINESATATARLTENPVENGANYNDHIIIEPMQFHTEGIVSNISSNALGQLLRIPTAFTQNTSKAKEAWEELLELQISRTPFTLVQGLKTYRNIVILSLTENQNKDTANGLFFSAQMKELILVGAEVITANQFNNIGISDKMIPIVTGGLKQLAGVLS